MRLLAFLFAMIVLPSLGGAAEFGPGSKVAYLGLTFLDTSTEGAYNGARADEAARLDMLEALVAERFVKEGIVLLDLGPISQKLENTVNPANCYGCDVRMAKELNAEFVVVGIVQKVSNLILSMNLVMRDVETGAFVLGRSVDIRSNTDDSWARGMNYILKTTFFTKAN
ncbi:DUF3280 domain-containing protein [Roseibium sediminis]|uniref:DUF3280 domain-containing protein n=1 Tax=Roseibium sediminis TaxID=1775174 RepID=UPI00123D6A70|nr:DUF3280 domain-containing protein [Roseibium sediminis]